MGILRRTGYGVLVGLAFGVLAVLVGLLRVGTVAVLGRRVTAEGASSGVLLYLLSFVPAGATVGALDDSAGSRPRRLVAWCLGGLLFAAAVSWLGSEPGVRWWNGSNVVFVAVFGPLIGLAGLVGTGAR